MSRSGRRRLVELRYLALAGLVAPVVFVVGVVAAGLTWEGYSHRTQNISDLGGTEAPHAALQNGNFALFGLLVVVLALGLRRHPAQRPAAGFASLLVAYFGMTMLVLAVTPCTPGCAGGSVRDAFHGSAAVTGFLALAAATLLLWRRHRSASTSAGYATYSALTGLVMLAFLVAWAIADALDPWSLHVGTLQRVYVGTSLAWIGVTGAQLLRPAPGGSADDSFGETSPARPGEPG